MAFPLSVLDLAPLSAVSTGTQALQNSLDLARHVDGLGYGRYWVSEHHNLPSVVSTSPEVLIGHLASVSRRMRVGSGGIMLPNHAPLRIAEAFRTLAALHPGRIDLGLGARPGPMAGPPWRCAGLSPARVTIFPSCFMSCWRSGEKCPSRRTIPCAPCARLPDDVPLPPVWLLGSSDYGARLAARMGLGYAFAHHFSAEWVGPATRAYREGFRPTVGRLERPHLILTVNALVAPTDAEADVLAGTLDLWAVRRAQGQFAPLPSLEDAKDHPWTTAEREFVMNYRTKIFVGGPATVRARLDALIAETGADELMVTTMAHDHALRKRSYTLLSEAFGLGTSEWRQAA